MCTANCATIATVEDGRVTRLDADPHHPNGGVICIKGKAAPDLVYHPDRLDYPMRRTQPKGDPDPGWQRISWLGGGGFSRLGQAVSVVQRERRL